ncbi:MFS transporter [Nocardioides convexus]|uniref:MFS transporter n=1 Tax=Nocardioides convexus TaxID=2712224 RepID=UPI0024183D08|nr:MFS transporter [Nocardioides convexus]
MAPITNSLVFRLFDDKTLRMRAMTVMILVGMSGFILGPLLGGTALAHVRWEWLLLVNAPIALIAFVGVRLGVPADDPDGLTEDRLDLPGALLSITAIGLACWSLTSGVEHGWSSALTVASIVGAVLAGVGFVGHERRTASPMLDLGLFTNGTVRGAVIAQVGTAIAMASVMFGLILHFQFAYGWSPVRAGLANLPIIVTMILATPLSEGLAARFGHRIACLVGALALAGSLAGLAWGVEHGYPAIAAAMVVMTVGLRTVMTICAIALVDAMPANRTSMGASLNDTAQEIGTSVGTAVVGTMIAALVTAQAPGRHLERRARAVVLPRRADHLRRAGRRGRRGGGRGSADPHRLALDGGAPGRAGVRRRGRVPRRGSHMRGRSRHGTRRSWVHPRPGPRGQAPADGGLSGRRGRSGPGWSAPDRLGGARRDDGGVTAGRDGTGGDPGGRRAPHGQGAHTHRVGVAGRAPVLEHQFGLFARGEGAGADLADLVALEHQADGHVDLESARSSGRLPSVDRLFATDPEGRPPVVSKGHVSDRTPPHLPCRVCGMGG